MSRSSPVIWALIDDRPGTANQVLGLAEAVGQPFIIKELRYTPAAKIPNIFRGTKILGIDKAALNELKEPWPDWVIAAGRRSAPVARWIKKQTGGMAKLVQLMDPGPPRRDFYLIAIPEHDKTPGLRALELNNNLFRHDKKCDHPLTNKIVYTIGSPHRLTPAKLNEACAQWQRQFGHLPKPHIALLVGGSSKKSNLSSALAAQLLERVQEMAKEAGGSLLVTTSRRTPSKIIKALQKGLKVPHYFYDWHSGGENPYQGILACADYIVATGDSMSMCSEACATGKPVYIYAPGVIASDKHKRLHQSLFKRKLAQAFGGNFQPYTYEPPNVARDLAERLFPPLP